MRLFSTTKKRGDGDAAQLATATWTFPWISETLQINISVMSYSFSRRYLGFTVLGDPPYPILKGDFDVESWKSNWNVFRETLYIHAIFLESSTGNQNGVSSLFQQPIHYDIWTMGKRVRYWCWPRFVMICCIRSFLRIIKKYLFHVSILALKRRSRWRLIDAWLGTNRRHWQCGWLYGPRVGSVAWMS